MTKYSIEFAHIYTDESFNGNHRDSGVILNELKQVITAPVSSVVLIDDYNATSDDFSVNNFLSSLKKAGASPDFYAFESELVPFADKFLESIEKPKIARMHHSYIKRKNKYPCSLLTATWYLIRLGQLNANTIMRLNGKAVDQQSFVADHLINILPESFTQIEKEAHKLIGLSKYKKCRFNIQPVLFKEKYPIRGGFIPETVEK